MKNKILSLMVSLAGVLMFAACDNPNYGTEAESHGFLSFDDFGVTVEEPNSDAESRAVQTVDVSNYLVSIINKANNRRALYKKYGELPGVVDLPVGTYTVKVESHAVAKAEFDRPYYMGTQEITIVEDQVCDAGTIVCKFSSIRVSVEFSEKLTPLLGDDVVVTVSGANGARLEFKRNDTRSGYFEAVAGMTTLLARITGTVNGKPITEDLTMLIQNVQAGKHYVVRFKVKGLPDSPDEVGAINPAEGVSIDTSIVYSDDNNIGGNVDVDEEIIGNVNRPGQEDPDDPDDPNTPDVPNPPAQGDVKFDTALTFGTPIYLPTDKSGLVTILVESGLKNLYLNVTSTNDAFTGIATALFTPKEGEDQFDMANPPSASEEELTGYGLTLGTQLIGQKEVPFDITNFLPLLVGFTGRHEFELTVVPMEGVAETRTLIFIAQ